MPEIWVRSGCSSLLGSGAENKCRGTEAGLPRKPWGLLLPSQGLQPSKSGLLSLQPHTEWLRWLVEPAREQILGSQAAIPGRAPGGAEPPTGPRAVTPQSAGRKHQGWRPPLGHRLNASCRRQPSGPSLGEGWRSQKSFWLQQGQSRPFPVSPRGQVSQPRLLQSAKRKAT